MAKADLSAELARKFVDYDREAGTMRWLPRELEFFASLGAYKSWNSRYAGKDVAGVYGEYPGCRILRTSYYCHRLAWLIVTGVWPYGVIDHINGNKLDFRFSNLRDVDLQTNAQNIFVAPVKNADLPLGVFFNTRKIARPYSANIRIDLKTKHLGYFDTVDEAHSAYMSAKIRHHNGFTGGL